MANQYTSDDVYTEYDEREARLIEKWLSDNGYTWWQPTLCGNCCGMFDGYYQVNGIGGEWYSKEDKESFAKFAEDNSIPYSKGELEYARIDPNVYAGGW